MVDNSTKSQVLRTVMVVINAKAAKHSRLVAPGWRGDEMERERAFRCFSSFRGRSACGGLGCLDIRDSYQVKLMYL